MIQDRRGRLLAACWKFEPFGNFALFSEDHGKTWRRSAPVPGDAGDECQLVELVSGRLLMDIRQETGASRSFSTSDDGGKTWSPHRAGLPVSPVACAIERYTSKAAGDDRDRIVWTGPKGPDRQNLVVRISEDEGRTFPVERLIASGPAAYSDLTILKDRSLGVLWERGAAHGYQFITFTRLTREVLAPERPGAKMSTSCKGRPLDPGDLLSLMIQGHEHASSFSARRGRDYVVIGLSSSGGSAPRRRRFRRPFRGALVPARGAGRSGQGAVEGTRRLVARGGVPERQRRTTRSRSWAGRGDLGGGTTGRGRGDHHADRVAVTSGIRWKAIAGCLHDAREVEGSPRG